MAFQPNGAADLGEAVQLLYGQFQLKLEALDELVTNNIRQQRINELNSNTQKTEQLINQTFQEIITLLNQRKQALIDELNKTKAEKQKELQAHRTKDEEIQKKMHEIKRQCRSIISNKSSSYDVARKRKELSDLLTKNLNRSLNPSIDDPTLTLCSFRADSSALKGQIGVFGKIDNEDEKVVENLQNYYKLKNGSMAVTVVCANNLMAADSNGTSDPYAVLYLNKDQKKKQKTKVVKKTLDPSWDEKFTFSVKDAVRDILYVQVYDKDKMSRDELIGELTIPVITVLKSSGFIEKNYTFDNNRFPGTVQLMLEYQE